MSAIITRPTFDWGTMYWAETQETGLIVDGQVVRRWDYHRPTMVGAIRTIPIAEEYARRMWDLMDSPPRPSVVVARLNPYDDPDDPCPMLVLRFGSTIALYGFNRGLMEMAKQMVDALYDAWFLAPGVSK